MTVTDGSGNTDVCNSTVTVADTTSPDAICQNITVYLDDNGAAIPTTHDSGGYFDLSPRDLGEEARRDITLVLEAMGLEVEAAHHEVAPAQHEIDFKYGDALTTADNVTTFKYVTRTIAKLNGLTTACRCARWDSSPASES